MCAYVFFTAKVELSFFKKTIAYQYTSYLLYESNIYFHCLCSMRSSCNVYWHLNNNWSGVDGLKNSLTFNALSFVCSFDSTRKHFAVNILSVFVCVCICVKWFRCAHAHMSARLSRSNTVWLRHVDCCCIFFCLAVSFLSLSLSVSIYTRCSIFSTVVVVVTVAVFVDCSFVRSFVCFCFAFNAIDVLYVFFSLSIPTPLSLSLWV